MDILARTAKEAYAQQEAKAAEDARLAEKMLSENMSDCPLTDEQLDYLASKYDIDDIKPFSQEERDFLNELADMGLIPREDALPLFLNVGIIAMDDLSTAKIVPVEEAPSRIFELCTNQPASGKMIDRLMAIIENQKNITKYYRLHGKTVALNKSEKIVSSKQTALTIMQCIKARAAQNSGGGING